MNIFNRLRRKTVYILPSANASMVSQYANGFRDGRTQGYAAGLDAAREAVWESVGPSADAFSLMVLGRALAAIDALREEQK